MKQVSLSIFVITIIAAAAIAGVAGYYLRPMPPPPPPKPGEGMTIFWIGGAEGDPFDARLVKGATDAAELLGISLKYVHTGWLVEKMVEEFRKAIAAKPDGIVVMGHPGLESLKPLFEEADKQGIYVTLANVDIKEIREKYWYCGYVGQDLWSSGYTLGKAAVLKFNLKPGDRACIFAVWEYIERAVRAVGIEDAFKEAGLIVDRVNLPPAVGSDPLVLIPYLTGYYGAHPDVKVMAFDGGILTATVEKYMEAIGKRAGEIINIGFDLTPGSVAALKSGYLQLIIDQQPYLQGFMTVLNLFLNKKYGFAGLYIDTGGGLIDASNVAFVEKLTEEGYR